VKFADEVTELVPEKNAIGPAMRGYLGTTDIEFTFEGRGWFVDLERYRINADPKFFMERGYSESESLFASFHEMEHFLDMMRDQDAYTAMFAHTERIGGGLGRAISRMYNCLDDVLVNRCVMSKWAAGAKAKDSLYPKLFPDAALDRHPVTGAPEPRHRQFMYALLRQAMLPHEPVTVEPEVREAIERANGRSEGAASCLDMLTEVDALGRGVLAPRERFNFIHNRFEPIFRELYEKDLKDRKPEPPHGRGEPGEPIDDFGDDPHEKSIPDPIDLKKLNDDLAALRKALKDKAFKDAMGVTEKDFGSYRKDFERIKPYIARLSAAFDKVITRRIHERRVLRKPAREGVMVDPSRVAAGMGALRAGGSEPEMMLKHETERTLENRPSELEISLVFDGSGSMNSDGKALMQRQLAVLILESLDAFRIRIANARKQGEDIRLDIRSSARIFSDDCTVIKPLTDTLTHEERVTLQKALKNIPGFGNNEMSFFDDIEKQEMGAPTLRKLAVGDLKKVVLVLTDGESDAGAIRARIAALEKRAVGPKGTDPFIIAGIGFAGGKTAVTTYAPHGYYAESFEALSNIFATFLGEILDTL
jgi:hypothetical protein